MIAIAWIEQNLEKILATTVKFLIRSNKITAASILTNAKPSLRGNDPEMYDPRINLAIPAEVYFVLDEDELLQSIERDIDSALSDVRQAQSARGHINCRIVVALEADEDWRQTTNQIISGQGISNQGRVRSDNIAARQHEGLLFRSRQEIHFYNALKREGVPFAPLSVVLKGGLKYERVEPDFVIYKDGIVMIVEIDGDLYPTETPAAAHARLKFITDEGARLERITASECDTPEKAREAVRRIVATIDKLRGFRSGMV